MSGEKINSDEVLKEKLSFPEISVTLKVWMT